MNQISPAIEIRAREILGLDDLEAVPDALPVRAEQLWRMDRFAGNVPFTNPMFVPMGPVRDLALLHAAVAEVVGRHQALRTRLALRNGRAVQIVEDWKAASLDLVAIRKRELLDDRPGVNSAIGDFTQLPTNLYAQEGFHCRAFRDEQGEVTLGFLAHGFYSDAWSSQVLFREVRAAYAALRTGTKADFVSARQYVDYARTQRSSLVRGLGTHLSYWQERLREMPAARLPRDHAGSGGGRGRSYFFVAEPVVARLAAFARANRVSLTLVLLAAFQIALARWSGQREILSAAYTADRVRPEFRDTIGFLVTSMPVTARLDPQQDFRTFLAGFAQDFYGAYPHRELSCELYDAIFRPEAPFCAGVFNFVPLQKNFFDSELHAVPTFEGTITAPPGSRPAIYRELYLGLAQYPNGLLGKVFYDADLFSSQIVEHFIQHFRTVAGQVSSDATVGVKSLLS